VRSQHTVSVQHIEGLQQGFSTVQASTVLGALNSETAAKPAPKETFRTKRRCLFIIGSFSWVLGWPPAVELLPT